MNPPALRVGIVGAGAAGALVAVHLLREPRDAARLEIDLIDRGGDFGVGVAYGTEDPLHLLNVPAVRMGGISGHPEHFHRWLQARGEALEAAAFLPRRLYGTYLRDLLAAAERLAAGAVVRRHVGEVTSIAEQRGPTASQLELGLADGRRIDSDRVVLALGPLSGGDPVTVPTALRAAGIYIADPWSPRVREAACRDRSVLIIGTGLSMVDVVLTLGEAGRGPQILAVSRHGLLPRRHRRELTNLRRFHLPVQSGQLDPIVTAMLGQVARVARQGDDWRDVIDSMRPVTPRLWAGLDGTEKRRFLADLQRLWDVHRFRMPPDVADRLDALRAEGRLRTEANAIVSLEAHGAGARVYLRRPGRRDLDRVEVDRVVDCSGAGLDLRAGAPPLLRGLFSSGRARPDDLGLGLDVGPHGALRAADGSLSDRILAVGALRRGVEWEATEIAEIRDHAHAVAARIVAPADRAAATASRPAPRARPMEEAAA